MKRAPRFATLALVGLLAFGSAACGNDGDSASSTSTTRNPDTALGDYSRCMKEKGVDIPSGPAMMDDGGSKDPRNDPGFKAADDQCKHHLRGIITEDPSKNTIPNDTQNAMLKYAKCMRDNGVDMPDPSSTGLVGRAGDTDFDPNSPTFKSAHEVCKKHLGNLPVDSESNG